MKVDEKPTDPVVYISIDCEATGPVPGLYNLVSIGAVPVVPEGNRHRVMEDVLYLEFKPEFPGFQREAMRIHGITRRHLEKEGVEAKEGMTTLRKWALGWRTTKRTQLVFVGHNAPFDWSFISYYFTYTKVRNPFGYKALDTKSLAMGKLDIPWLMTNKDVLSKHLSDLGSEDKGAKHRADYDARYQARLLAGLLDYRKTAPARASKRKASKRRGAGE